MGDHPLLEFLNFSPGECRNLRLPHRQQPWPAGSVGAQDVVSSQLQRQALLRGAGGKRECPLRQLAAVEIKPQHASGGFVIGPKTADWTEDGVQLVSVAGWQINSQYARIIVTKHQALAPRIAHNQEVTQVPPQSVEA